MAIPEKYLSALEENSIYHVYNRTNNREPLFRGDENRRHFLQRFTHYLSPYVGTYCWCLLPNHFHFLIRVKTASDIKNWLLQQRVLKPAEIHYLEGKHSASLLLEKAFHQFFTSYSMAFNKMHGRSGNLFHRPFKRLEVTNEMQFTQTVVYIHTNPFKHKLIKDFTKYQWSSWREVITDLPTLLLRDELYEKFGSKEQLIKAHLDFLQFHYDCDTAIEE